MRNTTGNLRSNSNIFLTTCFGILSLFFTASSVQAADSTQTIFKTIGSDITIFWGDIGPFFTRPLSFDGADWRNTAVTVGGTGIAMALDKSGRRLAQTSPQNPGFQNVMTASRHYGDLYGIGIASTVTYLGGLAFQSDDLRITGRELLETLAFVGSTTTALKFLLGRSRPFTGDGPFTFHPFSFTNDRNSMASGHTAVAFSISSVLASRINNPFATILLYGAATSTAFSRMYNDQHWFSDTFLAAAIATATGLWVVKRDEERSGGKSQSVNQLIISPSIGGFSVTYRF